MRSTLAGMPYAEILAAGRAATLQPIANVWCIGRNYAAHAKEVGYCALP